MHFKQIEMVGFKSFADRTIVNLEAGMTAVVGPNGCGKSNILDAMRWALGEQKPKMLRGAHMQDVIFNGSDERAPMGMAEVTLTFDNSDGALPIDFEEVQVTRRVYRSGESEYLINKAPCRLRDVHELFMDTGIGTNAYSMIGQGKIGMVLSSKPEDRRFLFEEAAGIIKYKSRKKIAMRKLEQADQNLLRLGDIVHEVERQMRSLKRQVNAAMRHRELTGQLRELEIRASWLKQRELEQKLAVLKEAFDGAQNRYEEKSAETSQLEARHEELSLAKLEADRVLHARREAVHEIDQEMEKIERHVALVRQQIAFSREQEQKADEERTALESQASALDGQTADAGARLESLRAEQSEIDSVLAARQAELAAAAEAATAAGVRLDEARSQYARAVEDRSRAQTALETLAVNIAHMDEQLQTIESRRLDHERQREELKLALEEVRQRELDEAAALAGAEEALREARSAEQGLRDARETANSEWQGLREERGRVEARLASFRELRDSYEGFAAGVKALMQARQAGHAAAAGVIGPVGELLRTAPAFERAIEAALGGRVDYVVIERAEDARAAIAFLRAEQAGRVTFLPLDSLPGEGYHPLRLPAPGRPLIHLVDTEDRYRPVLAHLLQDTYLVDSLADAIRIAQSSPRRATLVTPEGDVLQASGAITGGASAAESRGLLGRTAEIASLETALDGLTSRAGEAEEKCASLARELADQSQRRDELIHKLDEVRAGRAKVSAEAERIARERERIGLALTQLAGERESLTTRRGEYEARRGQSATEVERLSAEGQQLETAAAEAQAGLIRAQALQAERAGALADVRVRVAELAKSVEETDREHRRLQRETEATRVEVSRRQQAIEDFRGQCTLLENDIAGNLERSKTLSGSREEARSQVVEAENHRQTLLDESDAIEKSLKTLREQAREAQNEVHRIEIDLRHDEDQLEFFRERILNEYHVALASMTEEEIGADEHDAETRERLIQEIRERLERLGPVNLMAIEEYEALTERHEFLTTQDGDLRAAREALVGVIERIDKTITEMFVQTFTAVAENFKNYFRRLFNGGQARLYLTDENDPLECGIEIEARPPGKKPQTLSLLSGGEQAMTAIALLFSIFKAKPSAFCVLDEVDAPLDDANIGRFVALVEEFTADTQFVVITHNKQTMAQADALYGVTQQERGISQIVSVRFGDVREGAAA